jgi:hypothetical protein
MLFFRRQKIFCERDVYVCGVTETLQENNHNWSLPKDSDQSVFVCVFFCCLINFDDFNKMRTSKVRLEHT